MELLSSLAENADCPLDFQFLYEGFKIRVVSIPKVGFTFCYMDDRLERVTNYREVIRNNDPSSQFSIDSIATQPLKFEEVRHENEPVRVWVDTVTYSFTIPEKFQATDFINRNRLLTVTEWTKFPSHTISRVAIATTELNLKRGFKELIDKIKERYESNNKILLKLNKSL